MDASNYEYYRKIINDIYLRTFAQNIYTVNANDVAQIYSIAHLCPLAGGPAVIDARALYELIGRAEYNDLALCQSANDSRSEMVRTGITNTDSLITPTIIKLYPNPAKNQLILEWIAAQPSK